MNRTRVRMSVAVSVVVLASAVMSIGVAGCRRSAAPASASQPAVTVSPAASQDNIYLYFSPGGSATDAIVEQIGQARKTLEIQAYQFTSAPIAKALMAAQKRGVQITVILDPTQEGNRGPAGDSEGPRYSSAQFLHNQGIPVYIDHKHAIAHNKVMLIDGWTIITGSFNFTKAAQESNAENLLVIINKSDLYAAYDRNFRAHLKHSVAYEGRETREQAPSKPQRGRSSRQPAPAR